MSCKIKIVGKKKILGNEEILRLFPWVLIDLMIREFELVTC